MVRAEKHSNDLDVVVIGHIIIETIVFPDGSVLTPVLGSPAAYSSVALAKLGCKVGLCTKVGKDMPSELVSVFEKARVGLQGLVVAGEYSTRNQLVYTHMEQKRVIYERKAPSFTIHDLPKSYKNAKLFYVCPMDFEVPVEMVKELATLGRPIFVDLGGYGGATSSSHQCGESSELQQLKPILESASVIKASFEDCGLILGKPDTKAPAAETAFAEKLVKLGAEKVVITLGSQGVYLHDHSGGSYFPPFYCEAVDTTGAGDTFCAGLIHEYIRSHDMGAAIRFGEAVACLVIEKTGGVDVERMPSREKVIAFINAQSNSQRKEGSPWEKLESV